MNKQKAHLEMLFTMTNKSRYVTQCLHSTTLQVSRWRVCVFVCVRVRVSVGQFVKSHVGNDRGPLHPSWLSQVLLEGNLDGGYQNESEERPILRAINIKLDFVEKWQMWFRSDLSLQVFRVLTAACPSPPPHLQAWIDGQVSLSLSLSMYDSLPVHLSVLQSLIYTILDLEVNFV